MFNPSQIINTPHLSTFAIVKCLILLTLIPAAFLITQLLQRGKHDVAVDVIEVGRRTTKHKPQTKLVVVAVISFFLGSNDEHDKSQSVALKVWIFKKTQGKMKSSEQQYGRELPPKLHSYLLHNYKQKH